MTVVDGREAVLDLLLLLVGTLLDLGGDVGDLRDLGRVLANLRRVVVDLRDLGGVVADIRDPGTSWRTSWTS